MMSLVLARCEQEQIIRTIENNIQKRKKKKKITCARLAANEVIRSEKTTVGTRTNGIESTRF